MVTIGNWLFNKRNLLFPFFYLTIFLPSPPIFLDYRLALLVGGLLALSGQAMRILTIGYVYVIRGGRNRKIYGEELVTGGIFNHCRNPMYVGNLLMIFGTAILANSLFFLVVIGPLFLFIYQAIIAAEEHYLRGKFAQQFDDYCARVNRWWPRLAGLGASLAGMRFHWRRVLVKEYGTTYMWLMACLVLILRQTHQALPPERFAALQPVLIGGMLAATVGYGLIRWLKKSRRIVGD